MHMQPKTTQHRHQFQIDMSCEILMNHSRIELHSIQPPNNIQRGIISYVDSSVVKLYPLPNFDGNPEDWPLFRACYYDTTRDLGYNDRQNLMRLHKALQGNAKRVVSSLLVFLDNVSQVIEELQFNFGRPELLVRVEMHKIQQFPLIVESRVDKIVDFSNLVRNIVAFLRSANCEYICSTRCC
ncbi:uncharacterized protein LOC118734718 [Rhagoletis pomonella]|uniref:uncharacterized protein LOC118734718 n=1 Tax=Rhagoletis pomonella TaxID=28610 RepID=UPI00178693F5|nr:uncharacterized protein LOC118734718 [Rhagoletis pomonella]